MSALTRQQAVALAAINRLRVVSPVELGELLQTAPEGAAATASSLVRRGLARRVREGGHVRYEAVSA